MSLDQEFYARTSMSGWVFIGVVLTIVWSADPSSWRDLLKWLSETEGGFGPALLGALIGISGPPAFGMIIDRIASLFLVSLSQNLWDYPAVSTFGSPEASASKDQHIDAPSVTGSALFHVAFYSDAREPLLGWARRTRTRVFSTLSAVLAAILGILFALWPLGLFSAEVAAIVAVFGAGMGYYVGRELDHHREMVTVWIAVSGPKAHKSLLTKTDDP